MTVFSNENLKIKILAYNPSKTAFDSWDNFANTFVDWARNLDVSFRTYSFGDAGNGRINQGSKYGFDQLRENSRLAVRDTPSDWKILITGHSLGGSISYMMALEMATAWGRRPDGVYTFGSPNPGLADFQALYTTHVGCDRTLAYAADGKNLAAQDLVADNPGGVGYGKPCGVCNVPGEQWDTFKSHDIFVGYQIGIQARLNVDLKYTPEINEGCNAL